MCIGQLIEGSSKLGVAPHIQEFTYADGSGILEWGRKTALPGVAATDQLHHYGYWEAKDELWVPVWFAKKTFVIDTNSMQVIATYDTGLGGAHVNFSDTLGVAVITNHFSRHIQVIERDGTITNIEVTQASDTHVEELGYWRQSHINHITPDGLFFHLFSIQDGIFVEVDLKTKKVSRTLFTGGKPEQSSS